MTVTAEAKSKTYGDADPALTYTGALHGTDSFTGSLARVSGENVGSYAINQGTLSAGSNYALTFVGANLTISARPVTVTADAKSKTYGDADPALTYTGALHGTDSFTGSLARVAGENVGTYAINQGTLSAGSNYALTFVGANLTITKATLTVTADNKSRQYGDANPLLTATFAGFKFGQTLPTSGVTGAPALTTTATQLSVVGPYVITAGLGTLASGNYAFDVSERHAHGGQSCADGQGERCVPAVRCREPDLQRQLLRPEERRHVHDVVQHQRHEQQPRRHLRHRAIG